MLEQFTLCCHVSVVLSKLVDDAQRYREIRMDLVVSIEMVDSSQCLSR